MHFSFFLVVHFVHVCMCIAKYKKRRKFAQIFSIVNTALIEMNEIGFKLRKDVHLQRLLIKLF